jgi:hypothetical protein
MLSGGSESLLRDRAGVSGRRKTVTKSTLPFKRICCTAAIINAATRLCSQRDDAISGDQGTFCAKIAPNMLGQRRFCSSTEEANLGHQDGSGLHQSFADIVTNSRF